MQTHELITSRRTQEQIKDKLLCILELVEKDTSMETKVLDLLNEVELNLLLIEDAIVDRQS